MERKKMAFIITHSTDDPERATLPLMLANGAITMGAEPVVVLQAEGVRLAVKGFAAGVAVEGMEPAEDLVAGIIGSGYRIMVCSPCLSRRGHVEGDLREGTYIGGAAKLVEILLECESSVVY